MMDVEEVCGTVETRPIGPVNLADHPKRLSSPSVAVGTIILTLKKSGRIISELLTLLQTL
jgi:hypothetical protein